MYIVYLIYGEEEYGYGLWVSALTAKECAYGSECCWLVPGTVDPNED